MVRRGLSALLVPVLVAGLFLVQPQPSHAASGGRIGGGSFRAPSMPRSGGYGRSYGGGYGGGYGRSYGGGGIGFPFIVPFFGFGSLGGLLGLFALMAVVGVIANAFRGNSGGGPAMGGYERSEAIAGGPVTLVQLQIGLLASAKELQQDLRELAATSDTSSSSGLQRVLQETTLSLLRHPDLWVYANLENGSVPFNAAESTFNRLSMTERSKLREELTTNVSGQRSGSSAGLAAVGDADATNEFIAVTVLVASRRAVSLKGIDSSEGLRESLRILGSTSSTDLMALEVIWQPDGAGEVLSADELVTAYPNLQHV